MPVARPLYLVFIPLVALLFACSAPVTPTAGPNLVSAPPTSESDAVPTDTALPPTATPAPSQTPLPAQTATPLLQITLLTPTYTPTYPPLPTPPPIPTGPLPVSSSNSAAEAAAAATRAARPSEIGNSAADAALVAVLQRCWGVAEIRLLNGNLAAHRNNFECARASLLAIVQNYPAYPLVHRVLAWGYFYKDQNQQKAIAEYRTAVNLYKQQGNKVGESEARMRLALLIIGSNQTQGCAELALAANLDPTNDRAADYYSAFRCQNVTARTSEGETVAPPPAIAQVDLAAIHGKIVFKSDREGAPAYYVMDPDGQNVKRISGATYDAAAKFEAWSPDRSQAATVRSAGFTRKFGYDNDIWVTDPSGGSGRPLTNPANDYDPAWSPVALYDGRTWIAFVSNRGDLEHPDNLGEELWVMHEDGTGSLRLTCHGPFYSKHPSWSPDGSKIVFHTNWPGDRPQIRVMDVSAFGTLQDYCVLGDGAVNVSNSSSSDSEPVWVK
jgi:hypothetical protein